MTCHGNGNHLRRTFVFDLKLSITMAAGVSESAYFERQLSGFTTQDELYGPLSLSELRAGRQRRAGAGYLQSAHVAFLDELFKAVSEPRISPPRSRPAEIVLLQLVVATARRARRCSAHCCCCSATGSSMMAGRAHRPHHCCA